MCFHQISKRASGKKWQISGTYAQKLVFYQNIIGKYRIILLKYWRDQFEIKTCHLCSRPCIHLLLLIHHDFLLAKIHFDLKKVLFDRFDSCRSEKTWENIRRPIAGSLPPVSSSPSPSQPPICREPPLPSTTCAYYCIAPKHGVFA